MLCALTFIFCFTSEILIGWDNVPCFVVSCVLRYGTGDNTLTCCTYYCKTGSDHTLLSWAL
jgi:hypothetical protein